MQTTGLAHGICLAALPEREIRLLQRDPWRAIQAGAIERVSHLLPFWVQGPPLGALLSEVLEGGTPLPVPRWHSLRPPTYHPVKRAAELHRDFSLAWENVAALQPMLQTDWYRIEIRKVLHVFAHAASNGNCVASVPEPQEADWARSMSEHSFAMQA